MVYKFLVLAFILLSILPALGQNETIDNKTIIEMSRASLSTEIILKKISSSRGVFDVSAAGLIALKTSGVDDAVIAAMMERHEASLPGDTGPSIARVVLTGVDPKAFTDSGPAAPVATRQDVVADARTIAFTKSSLQPSRQALEKELMKRKDFQKMDLTILRYKESADLFVDIGFVSGSWITHRYVYRIYDRRSGAVVAAGETTSWGSLAENLAKHIDKDLAKIISEPAN